MNGNQTAKIILQSLVRWIEDENGKFYDPELHSLFKLKLKEIFDEFLEVFHSLGANVIYANPHRIIIST